ncbi:hypothetical protein RB653_004560 [Dictyostelium firmibasis]|uniref:RNA polymerase II assembly factor Rtp1 C-terminal domain-containing protein n=1 Tax=Dictyostelium firmibasis TaxID=79012 RepID=A0AAN7U800_9MYCE
MNTTLLFNNLSSLVSFVYSISSKPEIPIKLWAAIDENLNKVLLDLSNSSQHDNNIKVQTKNLTPDDLESLEINDYDDEDDDDNDDTNNINIKDKPLANKEILIMIKRYNENFQYFSKVLNELIGINVNENNNEYSINEFKIKLKYSLLMIEILLEIVKINPIDFQISLNDQKTIKSSLDLLIGWIISPCFSKGIGVPMGKRVSSSSLVIEQIFNGDNDGKIYRDNEKYCCFQLNHFVGTLIEIRKLNTDLNSIIASRYLSDLFASLLQLINLKSSPLSLNEKQLIGKELDSLLFGIYPELVFESLMLLLSGGGGSQPIWMAKCIGIMLSKCLMRPQSIKIILYTILSNSSAGKTSNKSLGNIVKLITTVPSTMKVDEYYNKISPQLIDLLHQRDQSSNNNRESRAKILETVLSIIETMFINQPDLTVKYIMDPILKPFLLFQQANKTTTTENNKDNIVIKEVDLFFSIEDIHKLISKISINQVFLNSISKIIPTLFQLYCFVSKSISSLKISCKEILSSFFKFSNESVSQLKNLILPVKKNQEIDNLITTTTDEIKNNNNDNNSSDKSNDKTTTTTTIKSSLLDLEDIIEDENEDNIKKEESGEEEETLTLSFSMGENGGVVGKYIPYGDRDFKWEADCIVSIFEIMKGDNLAGDLFVDLLNEFSMLQQRKDTKRGHQYYVLIQFIIIMSEGLGAAVLKNVIQVCTFIKVMLSRSITKSNSGKEDEEDIESLTLSLGILTTLLTGEIKVRKDEEIIVFDLLSLVEQLSYHSNEMIATMASQIKTIITAKKPIWLINDNDGMVGDNGSQTSSPTGQGNKLKEILNDLTHPLLPIRAHALIELRRLVLSKSGLIEQNLKNVLEIFKTQVNDDDTFIYGCSINGLSALGDIYPNKILPILTESFLNKSFQEFKRMKLGEALIQISQRCGEMLPNYADRLVPTFLLGCRDESVGVRTSSLSNLATLCEMLHYSIDSYLVEILLCTNAILKSDPEIEVRRGGIFIFQQLLQGLGMSSFQLIPDELKSIYNTLKNVEFYDQDEVCKYHARSALYDLEKITKTFIFPNHSDNQNENKDFRKIL